MASFKDVRKITFFVIGFSIFYLIALYYPILTLGKYLGIYNNMYFQTIVLILLLAPLLIRLTTDKFENNTIRHIRRMLMFYAGFCFILLTGIIVVKIFDIFIDINMLILGEIFLLIILGITLLGFINAYAISIKKIIIHSSKLEKDHRFVQISDIHIGSRTPKFLERVVEKINHLNPDFVCITGDLVDFSSITYRELEPLKKLGEKTYFVIGNHEGYCDQDKIVAMLKKMNITVLRDHSIIRGDLQIIGIDDREKSKDFIEALEKIHLYKDKFQLLMYHRPHGFHKGTAKLGIDLQISGHTHKGQIYPFNLIVKLQFKELQGHYKKGKSHLYVSPGTGTWGPTIRLGSRNEITLFELKKE